MSFFDIFKSNKKENEKRIDDYDVEKINENIAFIISIFHDLIVNKFNINRKQLLENGDIYYMNGKNGTKFDWDINEHISSFIVSYKNGSCAIELICFKDGTINAFAYKMGEKKPYNSLSTKASKETIKKIAVLMYAIADCNGLFNQSIYNLNFTYYCNDKDIEKFEESEI